MFKSMCLSAAVILCPVAANAVEPLLSQESAHSVQATTDKLVSIVESKGLNVFARIDHEANAHKMDLELRPIQVLIFGSPVIGNKLMECSQTIGIDLPLKVLVSEDQDQKVWVTYQNPQYLKTLHNVKGCDAVIDKVSGALKGITSAAAQ
ncbi:DUF302 domain-containing protein [Marinomonas sp. A79]|uniref:DUF302 domain-containing protein n=1 Tax=Marinomonas vulgaris TaxID=2823372 RepID=A0ABS5HAT2_9GAMM|nr:DUF302 domain-containing protein [Marinomonas vulgaris]MBR7888773.1 DUF302 domain-containing protein [Marinomonas vulgaris]